MDYHTRSRTDLSRIAAHRKHCHTVKAGSRRRNKSAGRAADYTGFRIGPYCIFEQNVAIKNNDEDSTKSNFNVRASHEPCRGVEDGLSW